MSYVLEEKGEQHWHRLCALGAYSLMGETIKHISVIKWNKFCGERHGDCRGTNKRGDLSLRKSEEVSWKT